MYIYIYEQIYIHIYISLTIFLSLPPQLSIKYYLHTMSYYNDRYNRNKSRWVIGQRDTLACINW